MTIPVDTQNEIRRLAEVEKWKPATVEAQLGVKVDAARRVLGKQGNVRHAPPPWARFVDPFVDFIDETLSKAGPHRSRSGRGARRAKPIGSALAIGNAPSIRRGPSWRK